MPLNQLLQESKQQKYANDYHIIRFYSAFVAISQGQVVDIMGSFLEHCPLAKMLYRNVDSPGDIRGAVKAMVELKIKQFGFFTPRRNLIYEEIAVPFGASEMLMGALSKGVIDSAVVVCDGAGSVVVENSKMVQGIGARMNGLFFTTPIEDVKRKLKKNHCHVVFEDAKIDQVKAVECACQQGFKNIAVTVNAFSSKEKLGEIRLLESKYGVNITILVVCTTGIDEARTDEVLKNADVVWSCASSEIREIVGRKSILQVSKKIPVFVLTEKGLRFLSSYADNPDAILGLDVNKQYLLSRMRSVKKIILGKIFPYYLSETHLPVRDKNEPRFQ